MGEFADRISQVLRETADDLRYYLQMQNPPKDYKTCLDIASVLTQDYQMIRNSKHGKSEVLLSNDRSSQRLILVGKHLTKVKRKSLSRGVPEASGVTDSMTMDRIHKATDDLVLARPHKVRLLHSRQIS